MCNWQTLDLPVFKWPFFSPEAPNQAPPLTPPEMAILEEIQAIITPDPYPLRGTDGSVARISPVEKTRGLELGFPAHPLLAEHVLRVLDLMKSHTTFMSNFKNMSRNRQSLPQQPQGGFLSRLFIPSTASKVLEQTCNDHHSSLEGSYLRLTDVKQTILLSPCNYQANYVLNILCNRVLLRLPLSRQLQFKSPFKQLAISFLQMFNQPLLCLAPQCFSSDSLSWTMKQALLPAGAAAYAGRAVIRGGPKQVLILSARAIKKALQPGLSAACDHGVLLCGPKQDAQFSFSARNSFQLVSRRCMSGGAGGRSGNKTPEELLYWEQSLEKRQKLMDAERMSLDGIRLQVTQSWKNHCNVEKRLPPPDSFGFIKSVIQEKATLHLRTAVVVVGTNSVLVLVVLLNLKPGEAEKIPGNIFQSLENRWHSFVDWSRARVGLPALQNVIPEPGSSPAPSLPSQFVVVMGGSPPLLSGSIVVPSTDSSGKEDPRGSK